MITATNLTKRYNGKPVVDQVSFQVSPGEIVGVIGPNGAGKSTLLGMLAGTVSPSSGEVTICGQNVTRRPGAAAGMVGYVPQEIALHPALKVHDNLFFWGRLHRLSRRAIEERVIRICGLMGLTEYLGARVQTLSGGTRRKLNLAVALLADPAVLILDEPTAGVDIQSGREIAGYLQELASGGKAILCTTHSYDEIERLCRRVLLLTRGSLRFSGSLSEARAKVEATAPGSPVPLDQVLATLGQW